MAAKMIGCILLLSVAGTLAGPIGYELGTGTTCATRCPESEKFGYKENTKYEYSYENDIQTSIPGSTEEQSSLHMRATVQIDVISQCELVLKLTDVSLQDSQPLQYESRQHVDQAWEFKRLLQEKPLRFAFVDGEIDGLCPENEPAWVLNIKRGVLSAFQNTQRTLEAATKGRETDVSGDCPVEYSPAGSTWSVKKVKKVKNMLGCSDRHGGDTAFTGSPYEIDSSIKSLPLLKTTHECEQEVNNDGILIQSVCQEQHIFRPFSDGDGGAQTSVSYKLAFTKKSRSQATATPVGTRSSLLFDHTLSADEQEAKLEEATETMRGLCASVKDEDVRPETPRLFARLVRLMRLLDARGLQQLQASGASMCPQAEKYFRDSIPNVGTAASLTLIRKLISQGRVEEGEAALWLTHLAFVPQPSREMLSAVTPLLRESGEVQRKAALAVSAMVHNFCRMQEEDCAAIDEVQAIIRVFTDNLAYNCRSDNDPGKHDSILMALKALGNTGNALVAASQTLVRCLQNTAEPVEIRVAAIQAFRRMSCNQESMELMRVFGDESEDSEVRIAAYLMLMKCPNEDIVNQIQRVLAEEEVNQVGSFVYSHLTNLLESSDPSTRDLRELLQSLDLKAFDLDLRKFSRNVEWSAFSDLVNAGARAESNVIFSSKSYVPRSAMANVSVDLFGHSVNLFEVGGRVEGLEPFLESVFRGDGDNSIRQKRDVIRPSLLEYLDNQFKVGEHDGPKASYFVKVFGNEIHYQDFHGLDLEQLKDRVNFLDWLMKLSQEQNLEYTKSVMLVESELRVPTAAGLPLRLAVDATATLNLHLNGKMDVRQMFSNPATIDINGSIKPSAAVEVCSEMVVDAFVARAGLKMVSTLHSSTVTQGKISLLEGKVFHFDLEMPRDKQEIISTQSKFYVLYREEEREQRMIEQGRATDSACYDLTNALGIEICGEMSLPVLAKENIAKYPFTGPSSAAIFVNKKDSFSKYHMEGSLEVDKRTSATEFKLNINTPGSNVDRQIDLYFNLDPAQKTVDLNVRSPWKKATMRGEVTNTETMKRVSASATLDDKRTYSFVSELAIEEKKFGVTYVPKVELVMHNQPTKSLTGQVFYRDNKKFEIDLALENVFKRPVKVEGSVSKVDNNKRMKYVVSLDVSSSAVKGKLDGFVDSLEDTISSRIQFGYKTGGKGEEQRIVFSNKAKDLSTKTLTSWSLTTALETTMYPEYNTDVALEFAGGSKTLNFNLDAGFDEQRRIKITQSANMVSTPQEMSMNAEAKLEVPYKNLKYELTVEHLHNDNVFASTARLGYHNQVAEARIDAKKISENPVNAYAKAFLTYPGRDMMISHTIEEKRPNEYHNEVIVQLDPTTKATGNAVLKIKQGLYDVTADIDIPSLKKIEVEGQYKPDMYDFQAGGAVTYDKRKYHAAADWSVPKTLRRDFEGTHSLSFGCPARTITLTGKLAKKSAVWSGEHELQLDVERNPQKKINTEWSITLNPISPKVFAKAAWFPQKFVQMEAEGSYEPEGWYRTTNDLQASVKFTSSFPMLEKIDASIKHDYGHDAIQSSGQVSWGRGQTITAALDFKKNTWRDVDASVTVATPFPGARTMKAQANYKLARKLNSMASFEWEQKMIKIEAKGSADLRRHAIEGEVSFTSPFPKYQALSISGKHEDNGRSFNSNVDLSWGRNRKISATFTMEHQRNGYSINNNGEINVNTPFPGYQSNKVTWTHMNKDNSVSTRFDTNNDGVNSMVSLDGSFDSNNKKTQLTGNFMLKTPFMPDGRIKINHDHSRGSINGDWLVQWASNSVMEYVHNIQYTEDRSLEMAAKLTTPFPGYNEITLESKTTKNGRKINTLNEAKWSPNGKIGVDGTVTLLGGPKFNTNLRISTPFPRWERTVMNLKNDYTDAVWVSHADLDIARRHYEIDTQLGLEGKKKLTIDTTKMDYGFLLDGEFSGHARDFTTLLNVMIPALNENPVGAEIKVNCANVDNIKSSVTVNTPWRPYRSIKVTAGHKHEGPGQYITDASFEMPSYKASASHTMNLNKLTNFDCKTTVEYQSKKIELSAEMKDRPNMEGTIRFTSPYTEPITFVAKHEGSLRDFKSGVELTYLDEQKISADVEYTRRGFILDAQARVVTPYSERLVVMAKHNGPWKSFDNEASVEYGSKRMAASSKFQLNGDDFEAKLDMETPFRKLQSMKAEYKHQGPLNDFTCTSALTVNGKEGTHTMSFKNAKVMTGSMAITTPFPAARSLSADFTHNGKKWNNFENDGTFKWNNKQWAANTELRWQTNILRVIAKLKAPSDNYVLKVNHKNNNNGFTNSAVLNLSTGQKYSAESNFESKGNGMSGNFLIETPHESFDKMSGEFSQTTDKKTTTATAELKTPFKDFKRFAGSVSHTGTPTNFQTTVTVETPFRKLPSATFDVTHQGDRNEFACTASAKYGKKTVSAAANYKLSARSMEGSASLTTPYAGFDNFEGKFSHVGTSRNFKSSAEVKTPFVGHENFAGKVEHTGGSLTDFKSMAEVNTPYRRYERTAFMINNNGDLSGMNAGATLETSIPNMDKFDFSINHNGDPKNLRTLLKLTTPIRGYEEFTASVNHVGDGRRFDSSAELTGLGESLSIAVNHNGNLRNFNTELTVKLPVSGYENWGVKITHSGDLSQFQCSAEIRTPIRQLPELKLAVNHRGPITDFANGISAEYRGKKMAAEATWKYENAYYGKNYEGSLKVNTPWQNVDMSGQHKREGETKTGNLKVTHNDVQKVNLDYTYTTGATKNIRITFTEPKIFELLVNFEGTGPSFKSDASFEWERRTNVKVELDINNEITGENIDRRVTFKTTMPRREIGFDVAFTRTAEKLTQTTELQWDRDQNSKMSYALELASSNYRRQNYDGSFKFNSALGDFETTFSHQEMSARQTTTIVSITTDDTITLKRECTKHDSGMNLVFTLTHPRFSRDAILKVDAKRDEKTTEGEIDLQFEREAINFKGKIADESRSSDMKHVGSWQITYPNMRLDMKLDGSVYNDASKCGGQMEVNYQTSRDGMKTATSALSYDKQRRTAELEMVTPVSTTKVTATKTIHDTYNGVHMFEVVAERGNKAIRTEFGVDRSGRKIEAKFFSPRDEMLHVYAQYARPSAEVKMMRRMASGEEVNDIVLNINLDSDELVTGTAYMRPDLWSDVKSTVSTRARQQLQVAQRAFEPIKRAVTEELQAKSAAWETVSERPRAAAQAVYEDLSTAYTKLSRAVYRAYRGNEFHLKDICDAVTDAYQAARVKTTQMTRKIQAVMGPKIAHMKIQLEEFHDQMSKMAEEVSQQLAEKRRESRQKMRAMYAEYRPQLDQAMGKVRGAYKLAKDTVMGAYNQVINHPRVQQLADALEDLQPSDIFAPLRKLKFRASNAFDKWVEEHQDTFDAIQDVWNNIAQRQEIRDMAVFIEATAERAQRFWQKYDVQKNIRVWLKNLSKANWRNVRAMIQEYANEELKLDRTRWTTYDTANGNYGFELYVPYDLKEVDVSRMPRLSLYQYVKQAQKLMDSLTMDEDWNVWDTIYKYMPRSLNVRDWVPPFKAHATFAGNQHFMTFDKKFYEFSGECSYLLARDFIDGYFSVIANYQSQQGQVSKKSMTLFAKDKQAEIFPNGQVMIDGRRGELPVEVEGTVIKREASMIYITNPNGITIDCDMVHYRCTVAVSGWYFGKTGGLLGTYDNEPITDLMKPDNTLASSVEEMAESWIVGSRCRATNYAQVTRVDEESQEYRDCAEYFQSPDSPFRPCFKQVAPEPFMTMCLNDNGERCNAASYYVNECKRNSVNIRQPRECVRCEGESGSMIEGGNMTIVSPPQSADVVFVIQHGDCNRDVQAKLTDAVNYLERTFREAGMSGVRYGLVGFGGARKHEAEPYTRTLGGEVTTADARMLLKELDAMTLDGPFPENADVMSAVRYAALYPFRMGVSKSLVVLPCADCREAATRYTELQRILIERDIRLHMLMEHTYTLKGTKSASPKSGLMFGQDKNGLFIDKHVSDNELSGDAALRKQVTRPKDLCAALSEVSDGTVFARDMLAGQRPSTQKSFIDVFVRLLVKKAAPSQCQECECVADNAGAGQAICHHCEMNPIYNIMPDFEDDYEYEDESVEESEESEESVELPMREFPKRKGNRDRVVRRNNRKNRD